MDAFLASIRTSVPACITVNMPRNDNLLRVRAMIRDDLAAFNNREPRGQQALEQVLSVLESAVLPDTVLQVFVGVTDEGAVVEEVRAGATCSLYLMDTRFHVIDRQGMLQN